MSNVKVPLGYKQTEVGVIPEDWEVKNIGSLASIQRGASPRPIDSPIWFERNSNVGWLRISDVSKTNKYLTTTSQNLSELGIANSRFVESGSLVMSICATVGKPIITRKDLCIHDGFVLFRGLDANQDYMYYVLQKLEPKWSNKGQTGSQMNLNTSLINSTAIGIPKSLDEQAAIANALTAVDNLIVSTEKLIAKKEAIKTGTMQQLLTGKTRLPEFATHEDGSPKGFKQTELGKIPDDWEIRKIGSLSTIQRGASPRPIDSPIWFERNSKVGWLRISDVSKTNKYLISTTQNLSELGIANSRFVESDSLVMSICATVGKPIITRKNLCIHDGFVLFRGLDADKEFLYYVLQKLEPEWSKKGQTGSQMNLNTSLINSTSIIVPVNIEEQTAIATILSDMDAEIQALQDRLEKTKAIKQGMMQQLLTGKVRLV